MHKILTTQQISAVRTTSCDKNNNVQLANWSYDTRTKSERNQNEIRTKTERNQNENRTKSERNQNEIRTKPERNQNETRTILERYQYTQSRRLSSVISLFQDVVLKGRRHGQIHLN